MTKTPTASEIKSQVESHRTESHFFSRNNMKFAGDTMANFGTYRDDNGQIILYRKKPVKHGLQGSWFYNEQTHTLRSRGATWKY